MQYSNRIYVNPFLWNILLKLKKLRAIASQRNLPRITRMLDKTISLTRTGEKLQYYRHEKQSATTYIEEKQYEPIISMSLLFTCRAFAIFIRPIIIYVIYSYRI